jgi:2-polyprenyl-6-methoxyphenol hydroxylase-like FAD-dependent oxidoreductase
MGCTVLQRTSVQHVQREGDRVTGVDVTQTAADRTETPLRITARHYVDATGTWSVLRKAMGVIAEYPTPLRNVAFWDYWQDAEWPVRIGRDGTRIQIMSVGWGWLWFIPISLTRTSIGLVTHAGYYKSSGKSPEELYSAAIQACPNISVLIKHAKREFRLSATKDWSYVAERLCGENWLLAGDACGFADPILSAGLTLAQISARKVAYTILELDRAEHDAQWLKAEFNRSHRFNILQHHRFAEFWYASNACAIDLKEYCSEIAKSAGITLGAEAAFFWMATGGFTAGNMPDIRGTGFGLTGMSAIAAKIYGEETAWRIANSNVFTLNLEEATEDRVGLYANGKVTPTKAYRRGEKLLPLTFANRFVIEHLKHESDAIRLYVRFSAAVRNMRHRPESMFFALEALEALIHEGWVTAGLDETRPMMPFTPVHID